MKKRKGGDPEKVAYENAVRRLKKNNYNQGNTEKTFDNDYDLVDSYLKYQIEKLKKKR